MALPISIKEDPVPEAPKGPTPEELLAQERAERQRLEAQMAAQQADTRARFDMMERRNYNAPATTAAQAQAELGLSAEDIAKDPEKALQMLKDHMRREAVQEIENKYAPVIEGLAAQAFSSQVEALRGKKYAQDLMPLVEEYFQANPAERYQPGKATEVYERLVGKNLDELVRRDQARTGAEATSKNYGTSRVEEPPIRPAGALRVEADEDTGREPQLTNYEEEAFQNWKRLGVISSRKEWVELSKGNVFPKAVAADWQPEASRSLTIRREKVSRGE